jgi:hypothetical protein
MHLVDDVFNPKFRPASGEPRQLFKEQQKFVYSVFVVILLTDTGKALVREHESDYDAQAIFEKLLESAENSTASRIASTDFLRYLTTIQLGSGVWKGTTKGFLLHWVDKHRQFGNLMDSGSPFDEATRLIMLQNATDAIPEFKALRTQTMVTMQGNQRPLNYEEYFALMISTAEAYDSQRAQPVTHRRMANLHNFEYGTNYEDEEPHDIDTDIPTLLVHLARTRESLVPSDRYAKMSIEGREIWNKIPENDRVMILGNGATPNGNRSSQSNTPRKQFGGPRRPPDLRHSSVSMAEQSQFFTYGEETPPSDSKREVAEGIVASYHSLAETTPEGARDLLECLLLEANEPMGEEGAVLANAAQQTPGPSILRPTTKARKWLLPNERDLTRYWLGVNRRRPTRAE